MRDLPPIYLDHNATSPLRPEVREAMLPYLEACFGNPASQHRFGREAWNAVEEARERCAHGLGVLPSEIVFTSGGTEANHLAVMGAIHAAHARLSPKTSVQKLIVSSVEHSSILETCGFMEELGMPTAKLPVFRDGQIDLDVLRDWVATERTVVSIQGANHETGVLQPIRRIAEILKETQTIFHSDLVQWAGKQPERVSDLGVDLATVAPHKFGGPKGVGILVIRHGIPWSSWMRGTQEEGRRGGTPDVAAIVGAGIAVERMVQDQSQDRELSEMRDWLKNQLLALPGVTSFSPGNALIPNTVMVSFHGWPADRMVAALDQVGVAVSAGSACASGANRPSTVLLAMGYSEDEARQGVRFSLGWNTTWEDVISTMGRLRAIWNSESN